MRSEQIRCVVEKLDSKGFFLILEHPDNYPSYTTDLHVATRYEDEAIAQVFIDGLAKQKFDVNDLEIKKLKVTYELEEC